MNLYPPRDVERESRIVDEICTLLHDYGSQSQARARRWIKGILLRAQKQRAWYWTVGYFVDWLDEGMDVLDLAGDINAIQGIWAPGELRARPLSAIVEARQKALASGGPNAAPEVSSYALEAGRRVHLWPAPSKRIPFAVIYYKPLNIEYIPDEWEPIILDGVLAYYGQHFDRDALTQNHDAFERRFLAGLRGANIESFDAVYLRSQIDLAMQGATTTVDLYSDLVCRRGHIFEIGRILPDCSVNLSAVIYGDDDEVSGGLSVFEPANLQAYIAGEDDEVSGALDVFDPTDLLAYSLIASADDEISGGLSVFEPANLQANIIGEDDEVSGELMLGFLLNANFADKNYAGSGPGVLSYFENTSLHTNPIISYSWSLGNGDNLYTENADYIYNDPGAYYVGLEVIDSESNASSVEKIVLIYKNDLIDSFICPGDLINYPQGIRLIAMNGDSYFGCITYNAAIGNTRKIGIIGAVNGENPASITIGNPENDAQCVFNTGDSTVEKFVICYDGPLSITYQLNGDGTIMGDLPDSYILVAGESAYFTRPSVVKMDAGLNSYFEGYDFTGINTKSAFKLYYAFATPGKTFHFKMIIHSRNRVTGEIKTSYCDNYISMSDSGFMLFNFADFVGNAEINNISVILLELYPEQGSVISLFNSDYDYTPIFSVI